MDITPIKIDDYRPVFLLEEFVKKSKKFCHVWAVNMLVIVLFGLLRIFAEDIGIK